ncbi:exosortase family protein XrtF [Flavobacterium cheniae]|uniref:Exosortase family protein XrtF n=1 Tax=Flavobacterium cheniae TaxID=295428 RepID=A0A562KB10_9FLAO|nr:exosortase family protein XrtF [Flavobacterium cheniae]TDR24046.1 exosortase family protein XrtF [Flavobacterium cheniae]TWH92610.1 exosortase family protein XrtF [Flavobacterium cheniae]
MHVLKNTINQYKPFFAFLIKFLLFYVVFTFIYKMYLSQYDVAKNEVDYFTEIVSNQTKQFMLFFTDNAQSIKHHKEPSLKIFYKEKYVARVIEGCNAVSVMILFAAFVFAFSTQWKKTLLFIVFGIVLIHVLNVIRIALLSFALYYYPQYEEILHGTIFPLFIYGVVFVLWILWVTKFSGYVKRTN